MRTLLVGITVLLVTAAALALPARAEDRESSLLGRMTVDGVIASVDSGSSTFLLRVLRPDRVRRSGLDYLPVWVQHGTRIDDYDDWFARSALRGIHRGDRVTVEGFRLDDGRLLALAIDVKDRAFFPPPVVVNEIIFRGIVVARRPNLIVILEAGGGTRIILISATTRFRGLRASTALQANDSVVIVGQPNADGTVGAREVQVIGVSR
ncbi:MAG: hypothetical protein E6H01_09225 [Bacillati bacterium ANGP1]|uniref:DUF5666 domain-containing protein n=1 Tax=Candidatus Segetimicrobium genomatis TaxID=2569760 RepID=A0A537KXX1_9BACT|nr:MAG: hypothetical protein E6H01_09225 [Terrabacteria group bacterium ANGP1]